MTRGGARPGAGRPPLPDSERGRTVSIVLPARLLDRVDAEAERTEQSRAAWVRDAIEKRLRGGR